MDTLVLDTFPGPLSAGRFQAWELGAPAGLTPCLERLPIRCLLPYRHAYILWPTTEPLGGGLCNFFSIPQKCPREK